MMLIVILQAMISFEKSCAEVSCAEVSCAEVSCAEKSYAEKSVRKVLCGEVL